MGCRVALRTLAHQGLIELLPAQPVSFQRAADAREPAFIGLTFQGPLTALGRIWLEPVEAVNPSDRARAFPGARLMTPAGVAPPGANPAA